MDSGKAFFFGPSILIFKSSKLAIFVGLPHFSRNEGRISKIEGWWGDCNHQSKTSYSAGFRKWGAPLNFGKVVNQDPRPKTNAISLWCSFPKLRGAPHFWKSGQPATSSKKKCPFEGVKPQKNQPTFFGGFSIHMKNTFCKKIGSKRHFQASAVVGTIYRRL